MKKIFILPTLVLGTLALTGCQLSGGGVDLTPVREGLSFLGLGIVLAALIGLIGRSPK